MVNSSTTGCAKYQKINWPWHEDPGCIMHRCIHNPPHPTPPPAPPSPLTNRGSQTAVPVKPPATEVLLDSSLHIPDYEPWTVTRQTKHWFKELKPLPTNANSSPNFNPHFKFRIGHWSLYLHWEVVYWTTGLKSSQTREHLLHVGVNIGSIVDTSCNKCFSWTSPLHHHRHTEGGEA